MTHAETQIYRDRLAAARAMANNGERFMKPLSERDIISYLGHFAAWTRLNHRRATVWTRLRFAWHTFRYPGALAAAAVDEASRRISGIVDDYEAHNARLFAQVEACRTTTEAGA